MVVYIECMSEREDTAVIQQEERTLSKYIKCKLSITLALFAEAQNTHKNTLYERWKTERGRRHIENAAFRMYIESKKSLKICVDMFEEL